MLVVQKLIWEPEYQILFQDQLDFITRNFLWEVSWIQDIFLNISSTTLQSEKKLYVTLVVGQVTNVSIQTIMLDFRNFEIGIQ